MSVVTWFFEARYALYTTPNSPACTWRYKSAFSYNHNISCACIVSSYSRSALPHVLHVYLFLTFCGISQLYRLKSNQIVHIIILRMMKRNVCMQAINQTNRVLLSCYLIGYSEVTNQYYVQLNPLSNSSTL